MCDYEKAIEAYEKEQLELDRSKLKVCNKTISSYSNGQIERVHEEINDTFCKRLDELTNKYIAEKFKNENDPWQMREAGMIRNYCRYLKTEIRK